LVVLRLQAKTLTSQPELILGLRLRGLLAFLLLLLVVEVAQMIIMAAVVAAAAACVTEIITL
jgi:hypothetical protein